MAGLPQQAHVITRTTVREIQQVPRPLSIAIRPIFYYLRISGLSRVASLLSYHPDRYYRNITNLVASFTPNLRKLHKTAW